MNKIDFAKVLALFALTVLVFSTVQPALMAYAKEGEKKGEDAKAEDKKNGEQRGNDNTRQGNSPITAEMAKANAIAFLKRNYGQHSYAVTEIESTAGNHRLRVDNGTVRFRMLISGKDGRVLSVVIEKNEQKKQDQKGPEQEQKGKKEGEEKRAANTGVSASQAASIAIAFLKKEFGPGNYTVTSVELRQGILETKVARGGDEFRLKVDGSNGAVLEFEQVKVEPKVEEGKGPEQRGQEQSREQEQRGRRGGDERRTASSRLSASQAMTIALDYLKREVGLGNYTVISVELREERFEIIITRGTEEFKIKLDVFNGRVVEFEREEKAIKLKVEKEDEKHIRVDINKEDVRQKLNVQVQKNDASIKLEFQGKENTTKSELELRVLFERLVEFKDNGSRPKLFDDTDTVVSSIDLRRLKWNVGRIESKDANGTITMITITQNASSSSLNSIAFIYHLTPTTKTIKFDNSTEATIRIWQIKFDVHIREFTWKSNDTMLALTARFNAEFEAHIPGEDTVKFKKADGITPFFNWGGNATADGTDIVVGATLGNRSIVLTYPHFNETLVHDPAIGYIVSEALLQILVPSLMAAGAIIIGTALLGVSALRSRRLALNLRKYAQRNA